MVLSLGRALTLTLSPRERGTPPHPFCNRRPTSLNLRGCRQPPLGRSQVLGRVAVVRVQRQDLLAAGANEGPIAVANCALRLVEKLVDLTLDALARHPLTALGAN